jgi:hypothetical protein
LLALGGVGTFIQLGKLPVSEDRLHPAISRISFPALSRVGDKDETLRSRKTWFGGEHGVAEPPKVFSRDHERELAELPPAGLQGPADGMKTTGRIARTIEVVLSRVIWNWDLPPGFPRTTLHELSVVPGVPNGGLGAIGNNGGTPTNEKTNDLRNIKDSDVRRYREYDLVKKYRGQIRSDAPIDALVAKEELHTSDAERKKAAHSRNRDI